MSFFSEAENKFELVGEGENVPTRNFLLACKEILPFLDIKIGPLELTSPREFFNDHIKVLQEKLDSDPQKYKSLQSLVESELEEGYVQEIGPCTHSILRIKWSLEFICRFIEMYLSGEDDMVICGNVAYEQTLKDHHTWFTRGIFQIIIRMLPGKDEIATCLKKDPSLSDEELIEHMKEAMINTKSNIDEINRFFKMRELDT